MPRCIAFTRRVPPSIVRCELTHLAREPIDLPRANAQHRAYEHALEGLGCRIERLLDLPDQPDSVFVEDAAIVFDEVAVIARPGAASRRAEIASVESTLEQWRPIVRIEAPATLDGGDVLVAGRRVYVGISRRTNEEAARQLAHLLRPHGYTVAPVAVTGCLHLKSAVTLAAADTLLVNPAWIEGAALDGFHAISVDPSEPMAANVLRIGDVTLCAAAFPRTRERLEQRGIQTRPVDASELAKAEGALTCCSLIVANIH